LPFLQDMVYEAVYWGDGERPDQAEVLARPAIARLADGWGRPGDHGLVAMAPDGSPIGAAWIRTWTEDNHTFGYVDAGTPEVAIALRRGERERGLGTALLNALFEVARSLGHARLSLAVEQGNLRALHVYEKLGFSRVSTTTEDFVMVLAL
jgi:GNAT superfamily N-acetyltransferase